MASSSTATVTSAAGSSSAATTTPALSVLYVTVKPLTDTFTPPASCGEMHLTQLSSPGYQIWLNEPQPVTQSQFGDCYPPGFIDGYTSVYGSSSSIAPMFSPMVCPQGWSTAATWTNGYIACCASGFLFHPPDTTVDENRPGYGGTCYSNFEADQTVKVTVYNSASVTATIDWVASGTTDQAYAHPIDGYQLAVATSTSSSSVESVAATQSASPTSSADASSSSHISGGGIAGAVIGSLGALALILLAVFFFARRYQRKNKPPPSFAGDEHYQEQQHQQQPQYQQQTEWNKEPMTATSPSTGYIQSPYYGTDTNTFDSQIPPYTTTAPRYELGSHEPTELDSGYAGRELDAGNEKQHQNHM